MTRIFLVRHGQTLWNLALKYQGHADVELSALGIKQAELLGRRLKEYDIKAVYSSDLKRAIHTSQMIAKEHHLTPNIIPEFKEISFGKWEGMTYNEIEQKWPGKFHQLMLDAESVCIPNGESFQDVQTRAMKALSRIIKKHVNHNIVIVSHGATIRTILAAALHMPVKYCWHIRQDNTALNIIDYYDDKAIVSLMNDTCHLE